MSSSPSEEAAPHQTVSTRTSRTNSKSNGRGAADDKKPPDFLHAFSGFLQKVKHAFERPVQTSRAGGPERSRSTRGVTAIRTDNFDSDLLNALEGADGKIDPQTALAMRYMKDETIEGGFNQEDVGTDDDESGRASKFSVDDDDSAFYKDDDDDDDDASTWNNGDDDEALLERVAALEKLCPDTWNVHIDESTSEPFFYNPTSGECVWSLDEVEELECADLQMPGIGQSMDDIDPSRMKRDCALLVVNIQRDFFSKVSNNGGVEPASEEAESIPGGVFASSDFGSPIDDFQGEQALLSALQKLTKLPFRKIVHCQLVRPPYHCSFRSCNPGASFRDELRVNGVGTDERHVNVVPPHCVEGSPGAEFMPEIHVERNHMVVSMGGVPDRNDFNPFLEAPLGMPPNVAAPPLAHVLRKAGIHNVFVVGMGLEYGVLQTCLEAKARLPDANVYYVEDCVRPCNFSQQLVFSARNRLAAAGVDSIQDVQGVREIFWRGHGLHRLKSSFSSEKENPVLQEASAGNLDEAAKLVYNVHPDQEHTLNDISSETGLAAAHMCAIHGHMELLNQLIFRGANLGIRSWFGDSPLLLAVKHGHLEVVKQLLTLMMKGTRHNLYVGHLKDGICPVDIDSPDRRGRTPLMWAVICRELDIFQLLLEAGADFAEATKSQQNVLHFVLGLPREDSSGSGRGAAGTTRSQETKTNPSPTTKSSGLRRIGSFKDIGKQFITALVRHIFSAPPPQIELAVDNTNRFTPLQNFLRLCKQQDSFGWSPVHVGSLTDRLADLPIKSRGVPVNLQDSHSCNAFHVAAWNGSVRAIALLLEGPSKRSWQPALQINLPTPAKQTPLDLATANGHTEAVHFMLQFGCFWNYYSQVQHQYGLEVPPQALLQQLVLFGATKSLEGLLCRDENGVTIEHAAIKLAKLVKHHRVCTFNFTSFTDPIVQYMYAVPADGAAESNFLSLEDDGLQNFDATESKEKIVCVVCRELCYPGKKLRLVRDDRADIPTYCQCDKSTCRCLVPGQGSAAGGHGILDRTKAWKPEPLDVNPVKEDEEFMEPHGEIQTLIELLARNSHRFWCKQQRFLGWSYGPKKSEIRKQDPDIVPWARLHPRKRESKKQNFALLLQSLRIFQYSLSMAAFSDVQNPVEHTKKVLEKLRRLWDDAQSTGSSQLGRQPQQDLNATVVADLPHTADILDPVDIDKIILPAPLSSLAEVLAKNVHETWCRDRLAEGWRFSPEEMEIGDMKCTPMLQPYTALSQRDRRPLRQMCRATLKTLMSWGYRFDPPPVPAPDFQRMQQEMEVQNTSSTEGKQSPRIDNSTAAPSNRVAGPSALTEARRHVLLDQQKMLTLFIHRIARDGPQHPDLLLMLNTLVNFGADVNALDRFKHSALYLAAKRGHIDTVKRLITLKATLESQDLAGMTPLAIAAYLGNKHMCRLLVHYGASIESTDTRWLTPLHHAAINGHADVCRLLASHLNQQATRRRANKDRAPVLKLSSAANQNGERAEALGTAMVVQSQNGAHDGNHTAAVSHLKSFPPVNTMHTLQHMPSVRPKQPSNLQSRLQSRLRPGPPSHHRSKKDAQISSKLTMKIHPMRTLVQPIDTQVVKKKTTSSVAPILEEKASGHPLAADLPPKSKSAYHRGLNTPKVKQLKHRAHIPSAKQQKMQRNKQRLRHDFANYRLNELHEKRERMRRSAPTPLMLAVLNAHADAVQVLVDYGMDPIYVFLPDDPEARAGPQPLSAYEHALLEYRNARIERQNARSTEAVDEDDDGFDDGSMVEVVKEKRWQEISTILSIFNRHEHVKRVRTWYAWSSFFRDATVGFIFWIAFWLLSPTSPGYGSGNDRRLLFAMQSTLAEAFAADTLAFGPEWLAWFESTLVEPFPTGLIKEVDASIYLGSPIENITAPGMLYDSNIMFLGDVRVTRRRSMPQAACPYFEDFATSEWRAVAGSVLPLVDIQLQNGWYPPTCFEACSDSEMDVVGACFYNGETQATKLKLSTWNATQRRDVFDNVIANGYVDSRTSRVTATSLLWNPDTAYLFQVEMMTDFQSGGVVNTEVTFDGLQLNNTFSPSVFFMVAVVLNIIWVIVQMGHKRSQNRVARRMEIQEGLSSTRGHDNAKCECNAFMTVQLILVFLLICLVIADFASFTVGRSSLYLDVFGFNETKDDDFQESDIRNERRALSEFDRQLNLEATDDSPQVPTVTDDAFSRIEYMLMVNEYEQQLMGIVLLFMGINVLYNLRLVPFVGNLVLAVMSTILDKLVLSFLLIWMLVNFFFAVSFNSMFSSMTVKHQSFEDSWFYTLFSGLDWQALFDEWDVVRGVEDADSSLSGKIAGCTMFFVWMVITLVFVNLFIGIVTDLYPLKRFTSNNEWEVLITHRMSSQLVRQQYAKKKKVGEHASIVSGISNAQPLAKMGAKGIFKAIHSANIKNTNIIKLGIMKASAKLHLLRGADGYRFWKRAGSIVQSDGGSTMRPDSAVNTRNHMSRRPGSALHHGENAPAHGHADVGSGRALYWGSKNNDPRSKGGHRQRRQAMLASAGRRRPQH